MQIWIFGVRIRDGPKVFIKEVAVDVGCTGIKG